MRCNIKKIISLAIVLGIVSFVICDLTEAKRAAAPEIEPLIYNGVKFIAPNTPQKMGYVEAWDIKSNKKVWEKKVYSVFINSIMEADVQWVFISSLSIEDGKLIVVNERGEKYKIDIPRDILTTAQIQNAITVADLSEAKIVAEKYLELIKANDYDEINKMMYMPTDYDQSQIEEEEKALIEVMEIYNEELGDLKEYSYDNYEWQDARHWTSGKIDPASLLLNYKTKYENYNINTQITVVKDGDKFKIDSFGISSPVSVDDMGIFIKIGERVEGLIKDKKK